MPIELKPAPGAGWGVFATRPIKKNRLILKETAIFTIMKSAGEQATENDVEKAWSKLSPSTKDALLPLRENGSQPLKSPFEVWSHNHLNLKNLIAEPYSKMNESVSLATTTGLFVLQSRINHSCLPNARRPTPLAPNHRGLHDTYCNEGHRCWRGNYKFLRLSISPPYQRRASRHDGI